MFTLAHLSDPHLSPLPPVSLRQLINKRATGFLNWHRRRKQIHDMTTLGRIVADLKAARPDHIAATGDFVNIALEGEFMQARAWLDALRLSLEFGQDGERILTAKAPPSWEGRWPLR